MLLLLNTTFTAFHHVVFFFVLFVILSWYLFYFFFFFFFFFKQKTAYEMRISDWSSDVCSSDLPCGPARRAPATGDRCPRPRSHSRCHRRPPRARPYLC